MVETQIYSRKYNCKFCGSTVYYSRIQERIICQCGKRKERFDEEFQNALQQLWNPTTLKEGDIDPD